MAAGFEGSFFLCVMAVVSLGVWSTGVGLGLGVRGFLGLGVAFAGRGQGGRFNEMRVVKNSVLFSCEVLARGESLSLSMRRRAEFQ